MGVSANESVGLSACRVQGGSTLIRESQALRKSVLAPTCTHNRNLPLVVGPFPFSRYVGQVFRVSGLT